MRRTPDHLVWKEQTRRLLASCSIFDLYQTRSASANGASGDFYIIDAPDWVNVIPVTLGPGGEPYCIMVRQYRHGAARVTTEFPAGLVNRGETPREAAERELAEETGRTAGRITLLGRVAPNPAFMNNWCHTYLAEDLSAAGGKTLDSLENLETVEIPLRDIEKDMGTGELVNSLVTVALFWYNRHEAGETRG